MNVASYQDSDNLDEVIQDRTRFDCDDSDDEQIPVYVVNPNSDDSIWFRAKVAYEAERIQMMKQAREREMRAQQQLASDAEKTHAMMLSEHR